MIVQKITIFTHPYIIVQIKQRCKAMVRLLFSSVRCTIDLTQRYSNKPNDWTAVKLVMSNTCQMPD